MTPSSEVNPALLFHRPIRRVKIKISSKSVGPVVLISSSIGEFEGSKSNKESEVYIFLDTLPYGGYVKKGLTPRNCRLEIFFR